MRGSIALVLAACLLAPALAGDKKPKDPEGYTWEANYDVAKTKSAEQGTLLFLDFWFEG